jgi:hypothetical protein
MRWVLNGIFSFGAGVVGDGLAGLPSRADLMDMLSRAARARGSEGDVRV